MITHLTPGIYRRPRPSDKAGVALVRTDVAGFVGFAERGPILGIFPSGNPADRAVKVESWAEFRRVFGGPIVNGYLAYAVRGFFANGGRRCYVVRVGATSDPSVAAEDRPAVASLSLPRSSDLPRTFGLAPGATNFSGARDLKLADATGLGLGDLIAVKGDSFREFTAIEGIAKDQTVRLARPLPASLTESDAAKVRVVRYEAAMRIRAIAPVIFGTELADSPGNWGNRIRLDIASLTPGPSTQEFSLRVTVEPGRDTSRPPEEEFFRRASLSPSSPYYILKIVNGVSHFIGVTIDEASEDARLDLSDGPLAVRLPRPGVAAGTGGVRSAWLQGGRDGLAAVATRDYTGGLDDLRGLRLLEEVDEVAILVCPDAAFRPVEAPRLPPIPAKDPCAPEPPAPSTPPISADPTSVPPAIDTVTVVRAMLGQCERLRDRVAIVDPLDRLDSSDPSERKAGPARSPRGAFFAPPKDFVARTVTDWRAQFSSAFGAMYYPWLRVADPLGVEGPTRRVPPGGHIAGVYAQTDTLFGVQRPPANVALLDVTDVAAEINSTQQELLNPASVNAIRSFPGRGIRVWGARSLEPKDERWQFIHIRRLMSMIEKSVGLSTQWAVFEPNDVPLRNTLTHSLTVFLRAIWNTGGLDGATPSDGFYVKCDETNNPPEVVDAGQVVCQVGVAPVAPMEFIDFEIRQTPDGAQVVES